MSDYARGRSEPDEDRLPWLEEVDDHRGDEPVGIGRLLAALTVALVAIGIVVGGGYLMWSRNAAASDGNGEVIAAQAGPYKVPATNAAGMKVEGEGDATYAASEGSDVNGAIDLAAVSEAPVKGAAADTDTATVGNTAVPAPALATPAPPPPGPRPAPQLAARTLPLPPPAAAKPAPRPATVAATPVAAPTMVGGGVQLGAFSSEAKANAAWETLAKRFAFLAPLEKQVQPVAVDGRKTLYRLRAAASGQAGSICGRLKVAGETCQVIGG